MAEPGAAGLVRAACPVGAWMDGVRDRARLPWVWRVAEGGAEFAGSRLPYRCGTAAQQLRVPRLPRIPGLPTLFPAPGASVSPVPVSGRRWASSWGRSTGGSGGPQRVWRGAASPRPVPFGRSVPCRPRRLLPAALGTAGRLARKPFRATFDRVAGPAAELTHVFLQHCKNCYSQQPASSLKAYFEEQNKKLSPLPLVILYWSSFVVGVFQWLFFLACSLYNLSVL